MKRIDFLGANGIGKSTVYAHLLKRRRGAQAPSWLTLIEAKRRIAVQDLMRRRSTMDLARAATCYLPKMGKVFAEAYTIRKAENAFAEGGHPYQPFFEHCVETLMGAARPSSQRTAQGTEGMQRVVGGMGVAIPGPMTTPLPAAAVRKGVTPTQYLSLSRIFGRLKELCLLEPLEETVVFDESLTHTLTGMLTDIPSDLSVRAHFEEIPLPDGVVHLRASEDEVLRRIFIKQRSRGPIVRHRGLDEDELRRKARRTLRIAEIGASTLEWRGARMLRIDATEEPEANAEKIEEFIGRMESV